MFEVSAIFIILAIVIVLFRAIKGPKVYDRILAVNVIGTKTVILIALVGFIYERPHFLDIAIVYALINFIATFAILKFGSEGGLD
jgi:multicomponent Na+:H+ antiporter subunit F|tara:strand:+ start:149 stop:403 length:255 start_codon:yes stop_codon:yes gene_type:complete